MAFFGKVCQITSISLIASSGAVVIGSAAMLGVGTNQTYVVKDYSPGEDAIIGVGALNFGNAWINGQKVKWDYGGPLKTYNDFVEYARFLKENVPTESLDVSTKSMIDNTLLGYDLMIAGSVLLSVSSLTLIVGIILLIINMKKK